MYLDPDAFPFTRALERNWRAIRAEFESLGPENFVPWPEREIYGRGWDVIGLYAFGRKLEDACACCPSTTRLIEAIPGMSTAGFSRLDPGTHILPHCGYTRAVLRCHLGLVVPDGCSMRVGSETRQWSEGRCLVFDDTAEHEVWHRGETPRIVLLLDFARPDAARSGEVVMPAAVAAVLDQDGSAG